MKFGFLCFLLGLLLFNASAFGELSVEDIEKIRAIVKDSVGQEIAKVTDRFDGIEKKLDRNFAVLLLALLALIGVVIVPPRCRKRSAQSLDRGSP